jgi:nicotinamidase/pyrazinamidase
MSRKIHLILIDPQNSFCKVVDPAQQQVEHNGELCVPGAWEDMERVANMINRLGKKIDRIWVTLDSHQLNHIAHPNWFKDENGNPPNPFTLMRSENGNIIGFTIDADGNSTDVGSFTTVRPGYFKKTLAYLEALDAGKRYPHCIWPPHCLIGTPGHNVVAPLASALVNWCDENFRHVDFVTKGSNPFVEHFSAVQAEVVDPDDPSTSLNSRLIQNVMEGDDILWAGEAGSHCLANTFRDAANSFNDDSFVNKSILLTDGTSPVPGFETYQDQFVNEMIGRGMKQSTTTEYLA